MNTSTTIPTLDRVVKKRFATKISSKSNPFSVSKTPAPEKNYAHHRNADGSFKTPNGLIFYDSEYVNLFNIDHRLK